MLEAMMLVSPNLQKTTIATMHPLVSKDYGMTMLQCLKNQHRHINSNQPLQWRCHHMHCLCQKSLPKWIRNKNIFVLSRCGTAIEDKLTSKLRKIAPSMLIIFACLFQDVLHPSHSHIEHLPWLQNQDSEAFKTIII